MYTYIKQAQQAKDAAAEKKALATSRSVTGTARGTARGTAGVAATGPLSPKSQSLKSPINATTKPPPPPPLR